MELQQRHVAVLMGGTSLEHDISMASGAKVAESLNKTRYRVTWIVIGRDGLWHFPGTPPMDAFDAVGEIKRLGVECAFVALHGPFGEDGRLQGMLDLLGIPYTCSGCAASALAMDKIRCKAVVVVAGVRVARHVTFTQQEWQGDPESVTGKVAESVGFPCVVKTPCQGSSFGMGIPQTAEEFAGCAGGIVAVDGTAMAEQYIKGTEVTCAVLDVEAGQRARALPVTEIQPVTSAYFDFEAKYTPGATREITPAQIPAEVAREVQEMAVRAHEAVGCGIWSRSDFMIGSEGPVWIEINTVPGMTPTSLYPQAAAAVGIEFDQLMNLFVEAALRRRS
ncbi:MAG: D-alanine--D-alanine ligase [Candidatus Hydrogenedentes bacterium]|nr:D-alanine--D-alanine ligase [Candidatus Hydrogenedentota bacterium]